METVQNSAYSVNTARPSSALSETSDGYIPMGDGYEDVSGYEPPTMMTVDNQAYSGQPHQVTVVDNQAYSGQPRQMTVVDNQAYSGQPNQMTVVDNQAYSGQPRQMTVIDNQAYMYSGQPRQMTVVDNQAYNGYCQATIADGLGEPPRYDYIYPNSSQLYEQIPERVEQNPNRATQKRVSMRKALCSFKQGKEEIGIRISILLLGALVVLLHLSTLGITDGFTAFLLNLFLGTIWPGVIIIIGSVELGIYCCRTNKKKASRGFATWDVIHSSIVCILYFLCGLSAFGSAGLFLGIKSPTPVGGIIGGVIYIIISILCFVQMTLYIAKACLMSKFFKKGWDQKVEEYMAAQSTNV